MKYCFTLALIVFSSCAQQPKKYTCFNPFMPIQSIGVDTANKDQVKETAYSLILTNEEGDKAIFPKSLCVEVREHQ